MLSGAAKAIKFALNLEKVFFLFNIDGNADDKDESEFFMIPKTRNRSKEVLEVIVKKLQSVMLDQ